MTTRPQLFGGWAYVAGTVVEDWDLFEDGLRVWAAGVVSPTAVDGPPAVVGL